MRRGRIILIGLVALVSSCASPPDKTQPPLSSRESDSEQPADTLVAIQQGRVNLRSLGLQPGRRGEVWGAPLFRPDGRLIVTSSCCFRNGHVVPKGLSRQLVVDAGTGEVVKKLRRLPHRARLFDFNAEGTPLFMGDHTCGAHSCSGRLYLKRGRRLERLSGFTFTADW